MRFAEFQVTAVGNMSVVLELMRRVTRRWEIHNRIPAETNTTTIPWSIVVNSQVWEDGASIYVSIEPHSNAIDAVPLEVLRIYLRARELVERWKRGEIADLPQDPPEDWFTTAG